jgi:hypothetical protein
MYYVAYYPDGTDTDCHMPSDWDVDTIIGHAWEDNLDGYEKIGPDPIKVEVYDDDHNLVRAEGAGV